MHRLCTRKLNTLTDLLPLSGVYRPKLQELIDGWAAMEASPSLPEMESLFTLMHQTQRMEWIMAFGLQFEPDWVDSRLALAGGIWQGTESFVPPNRTLTQALAKRLMDGISLKPEQHVELSGSYFGKELLHTLAEDFCRRDIDFTMEFPDPFLRQSFALQASNKGLKSYGEWLKKNYGRLDCSIAVKDTMPAVALEYLSDDEKKQASTLLSDAGKEATTTINKRRRDALRPDYAPWTLTYMPTAGEAALDGMDYDAYKRLFFEACDQPWPEIGLAQQKLIDAFDAGKQLHITNADGTDISFSIDGHSFANSGAVRNIPGSEFFSAPVKASVNGTIVAKGTFREKTAGDGIIRDITLKVKDGRIEQWDAAEGKELLDTVITKGDALPPDHPEYEGNRYFGEIGFGTNPHLTRHMCNGLLVEKISGSFHMAIGSAYGDGYLGKPVKLDNGAKGVNDFHWDVTTMLKGKDGEIWLDGHLMQKNGVWQAVPALGISEADVDVLNRGWAALPEHKRPGWFKDQQRSDGRIMG